MPVGILGIFCLPSRSIHGQALNTHPLTSIAVGLDRLGLWRRVSTGLSQTNGPGWIMLQLGHHGPPRIWPSTDWDPIKLETSSQTRPVWDCHICRPVCRPKPPQLIGVYGSPMECLGSNCLALLNFEQSLEELAENSKQSWGGVSPCPSQIQELSRLVVHLPDRAEAAARRVSSPPQRPKNKQEVEEPPYP